MSQETNRLQNQPNDYTPPTPEPKKNNTWIYWVVIALLVASNIYLYVNRNTVIEERDTARVEFDRSDSTRKTVESDYNAALTRLDELVSQNAEIQAELGDANSEVAKLKREIDKIVKNKNATASELGKAKRLIEQLNGKVTGYEERIAALETDNARLGEENTTLAEEKNTLSTEKENLIKLGSVLHASNIRMTPMDLRRGGKKVTETEKAKRVDVMRVTFDIDENRIAETSVKELYLRITAPDGNVLSNAAYGSGVTTLDDGQSLNYTVSKMVELQKNQPINNVVVDWNQDSDYKKGQYKIEIYQGGFKIGSGNVTLR